MQIRFWIGYAGKRLISYSFTDIICFTIVVKVVF